MEVKIQGVIISCSGFIQIDPRVVLCGILDPTSTYDAAQQLAIKIVLVLVSDNLSVNIDCFNYIQAYLFLKKKQRNFDT